MVIGEVKSRSEKRGEVDRKNPWSSSRMNPPVFYFPSEATCWSPHNQDGPVIFSPPPRPVILPGGRSPAEIGTVGCVRRFPTARKAGEMAGAGPRRWRATCSPASGDSTVVGKITRGRERSSAVCRWCAGVGGGVEWWKMGSVREERKEKWSGDGVV
jgi:hypothetical protein